MTTTRVAAPTRLVSLDRFRGLAVLAMIWDHLFLVFEGPGDARMLFGRLAMPAFFLLAGNLAGRPKWRHAGIALIGLGLPAVVPWIDSPNVLLWWACGVLMLYVARWAAVPLWVFPLLAAALFANGYQVVGGHTYDPVGLWALMALGAMIPRSSFAWAAGAPAWVGWLGRHPIAVYVGHVLVLQAVLVW